MSTLPPDPPDNFDPLTPEQKAYLDPPRALKIEAPPLPKKSNGNGADNEQPKQIAPAFSDEALALRFAECHGPDLRYVAKFGRWLSWAETHWQPDDTLHAFDLARRIIREAATACNKSKKVAVAIASAKTVASVERLAKSNRRLAASVDQWDDRLTILNTPTKGQ
jgi:phage/plasmid-associated DNA primase